jgi:diacylglycerol kinase (ATP)
MRQPILREAEERLAGPLFLIFNPRAGLGLGRVAAITAALRERGLTFSGAMTTQGGDARTLSRLACLGDFRAIVAVGGDGTTNEVVNGFASSSGEIDPRAVLGLIPSGTAQDFARGAGVPSERDAAIERLATGREALLDVGRIRFPDGRVHLFVNACGAGFDAVVAGRAADARAVFTSIPAHLIGFASTLADYRATQIHVTFDADDGRQAEFTCGQIVVANGPSYAGVLRLAPAASVEDGLLDVVVLGDVDRIDVLLNLPRALAGAELPSNKVAVYRARSLALASDRKTLVQADGEVIGHLPVEVDVLPGALRLIR